MESLTDGSLLQFKLGCSTGHYQATGDGEGHGTLNFSSVEEHSVLCAIFKSSCNVVPHIFKGKEFFILNIALGAFTITAGFFIHFFLIPKYTMQR